MHTQSKPNNITSNKKDGTKKTLNAPWILQRFISFNRKRLLQILAASLTQEQEQMGERKKSGRGVGEIWA
jgi:hypothetical protein